MILVIDDHPLFCEALQMTLSESLGLPQVATAATLDAGLQALAAGPMADAIVLDLNLPDVAGLDGLTRLRNMAPGVPVVVVSSMSDDRIIAAVMHAGAAGFVPKHSPRDAFVAAIGTGVARRHLHARRLHSPQRQRARKLPNAASSTGWRT